MYACVYVCMYVCMCVYTFIYCDILYILCLFSSVVPEAIRLAMRSCVQ